MAHASVWALTWVVTMAVLSAPSNARCSRDMSCWPTEGEVLQFKSELQPSKERRLRYDGSTYPCAIPIFGEQPLYGALGESLEALYYNNSLEESTICYSELSIWPELCYAATRNNPMSGNAPQFVVWATDVSDVQRALAFAKDHDLCVAVQGTGHDFADRHSCEGGVLIRTTLLKDIEWNLTDTRWAAGTVKVGSGLTFSELSEASSNNNRMLAQGWSKTVGVAGWSLGGGHGPFANKLGLGVDNIVAAEVVLANGTLVEATSETHNNLLWALRGGGGSTWGVVVSFTLRAHFVPTGGLTQGTYYWAGDFCDTVDLHVSIDGLLQWHQELSANFSGLTYFTPTEDADQCGATWAVLGVVSFMGAQGDPEYVREMAKVQAIMDGLADAKDQYLESTTYASQWERVSAQELEYINPTAWLESDDGVGGVPSILATRDVFANGSLASLLKTRLQDCASPTSRRCSRQEIYHDITGNLGTEGQSILPTSDVSISPSFRTALAHMVVGGWDATRMQTYYDIAEHSYLSESAFEMEDWHARYWGEDNYQRLLAIKRSYDLDGVFWCRHCVGDGVFDYSPAYNPHVDGGAAQHSFGAAAAVLAVLITVGL